MSTRNIDGNIKYVNHAELKGLSAKQRIFLEAILAEPTMSTTEAARKAGYKNPESSGSNLMKHPGIQRAHNAMLNKRAAEFQIESHQVLMILYRALTLDPLDLFNQSSDGEITLRQLEEIPKEIRSLITELECRTRVIDEDGNTETFVKVKWVSKDTALQLCMRHLGLLQDKVEVKGSVEVDFAARLRAALSAPPGAGIIDDNTINGMVVSK